MLGVGHEPKTGFLPSRATLWHSQCTAPRQLLVLQRTMSIVDYDLFECGDVADPGQRVRVRHASASEEQDPGSGSADASTILTVYTRYACVARSNLCERLRAALGVDAFAANRRSPPYKAMLVHGARGPG